MNTDKQAQFPRPFSPAVTPLAPARMSPFCSRAIVQKKHPFRSETYRDFAKNSPFEAKTPQKLQKISDSRAYFQFLNSPDYPVCKPFSALFSRKNPNKSRVMVNLPNFPHKTRTKIYHFYRHPPPFNSWHQQNEPPPQPPRIGASPPPRQPRQKGKFAPTLTINSSVLAK